MPGISSAHRCCLHWLARLCFLIFRRSLTWFCESCTGSQRYSELLCCHLRYVPQAATLKRLNPTSALSITCLSSVPLSPVRSDRNAYSAAPKKRAVGDAAADNILAKKANVSGVPAGSDKSTRATSAAVKTSSGRAPAGAVSKSRDTSTGTARSAGRNSTSVSPQKVRCGSRKNLAITCRVRCSCTGSPSDLTTRCALRNAG